MNSPEQNKESLGGKFQIKTLSPSRLEELRKRLSATMFRFSRIANEDFEADIPVTPLDNLSIQITGTKVSDQTGLFDATLRVYDRRTNSDYTVDLPIMASPICQNLLPQIHGIKSSETFSHVFSKLTVGPLYQLVVSDPSDVSTKFAESFRDSTAPAVGRSIRKSCMKVQKKSGGHRLQKDGENTKDES